MKLGKLQLRSPFILSPLERVSCVGFREVAFQSGASLTWTPMLRCRSIAALVPGTLQQIDTHDEATLTGVQLLATGPQDLLAALRVLDTHSCNATERVQAQPHWRNIRAIDLNFGCPSPDVTDYGNGPAMLKRRTKINAIFKALVEWRQRTPLQIGAVGAKIRLGMNAKEVEHKVYMGVVEQAVEAGLDYLVVHARHGQQRSSEPPDWSAIQEIKQAVCDSPLAVIGNGNVETQLDCQSMMAQTGCDGVMIGRAAIHNPWVFRSLHSSSEATQLWPSLAELSHAQARMAYWARCCPMKTSVLSFHEQNYHRIREYLENSSRVLLSPRQSLRCRSFQRL